MPNPFIWVRRVEAEIVVSRDGKEVCRFAADAALEDVAPLVFEAAFEMGERVGRDVALAGIRSSLGLAERRT
jgi:hypothetical protein